MGNLAWERKGDDIVFKGDKGSVKVMQTFGPLAASIEKHAFDVNAFIGKMAAGSGFVGANFIATANVAAGSGAWLSGIFAKAYSVGATAPVTGYISAAEFECSISGLQNPPAHACIVLNMVDASTGSASSQNAYIFLRQYGTEARANNFLWIADHSIGTNSGSVLISSTTARTHSHSIKILVGSTPYWIMVTSTSP